MEWLTFRIVSCWNPPPMGHKGSHVLKHWWGINHLMTLYFIQIGLPSHTRPLHPSSSGASPTWVFALQKCFNSIHFYAFSIRHNFKVAWLWEGIYGDRKCIPPQAFFCPGILEDSSSMPEIKPAKCLLQSCYEIACIPSWQQLAQSILF